MFVEQLDRLRAHLRPEGDLRRAFAQIWPRLTDQRRTELAREAERFVRQPVPTWTASAQLTGAPEFTRGHQARRQMLAAFVMSACAHDTARYDEQIMDLVWAICEESAWAGRSGNLPLADDPYCRSFAETAQLLAWTCCLAYKPLARMSNALDERIRREISRRVCEPVIKNMELPTGDLNVLASLMVAVLLAERDSSRRWGAVRRLMFWMEDGVRQLGVPSIGVWQENALPLMEALTIACFATGNEVDLRRVMAPLADIPLFANLGGTWWLNPGEREPRPRVSGAALYRFGRGCGVESLRALGAQLYRLDAAPGDQGASLTERVLNAMYEPDIQRETARPGGARSGAPRGAGFVVARAEGFCAVLHGGDPDGVHRDAGDLQLFYRNRPVFCDLGVGFSATNQHNLPMIAMEGQTPSGRVTDLEYKERGGDQYLSADLAGAYPARLAMESWQRTLVLSSRAREVRLIEVFDLGREKRDVRLHFITPEEPVMQPQLAILGGAVVLEWERGLVASVEPLEGAWRILLAFPKPVRGGNATFILRPVGN